MAVKARLQAICEREHHQRNNGRSQNRVRNKDREVDWPHPSLTWKMHRTNVCMVIEITDQEDARSCKRCNHACPMQPDLSAGDQRVSGGDQDCAGPIQRGIQGGEEAVIRH